MDAAGGCLLGTRIILGHDFRRLPSPSFERLLLGSLANVTNQNPNQTKTLSLLTLNPVPTHSFHYISFCRQHVMSLPYPLLNQAEERCAIHSLVQKKEKKLHHGPRNHIVKTVIVTRILSYLAQRSKMIPNDNPSLYFHMHSIYVYIQRVPMFMMKGGASPR